MAAGVESGYGAYLKAPARYVGATVAGAAATWGDTAEDSSVITALAYKVDAQAESVNQAAILAGPLARDSIVVPGLHADKIGLAATITADRAGYESGAVVIIVGAKESDTVQTTTLTVIKRL